MTSLSGIWCLLSTLILHLGNQNVLSFKSLFTVDPLEQNYIFNRYVAGIITSPAIETFSESPLAKQIVMIENDTTEYVVEKPSYLDHADMVAEFPTSNGLPPEVSYERHAADRKGEAFIVLDNDGIAQFDVKRTYVGLRRNPKDNTTFYLTLGYVRLRAFSDAICVMSYLNEQMCFEMDTWEDRSEPKQYYKYFGYTDCSSSIFSICSYNESISHQMIKTPPGFLEALKPGNGTWTLITEDEPQFNLSTWIVDPNLESNYAVFHDLDISIEEARIVRHAIRDMSIIANPAKLYAALPKQTQISRNKHDYLRGSYFDRMVVNDKYEYLINPGLDDFHKELTQVQEHIKTDTQLVGKERALARENLRKRQEKVKSREELMRKLDKNGKRFLGTKFKIIAKNPSLLNRFTKTIYGAAGLVDELKAGNWTYEPSDNLEGKESDSLEVLNSVVQESVRHDTPFSFNVGRALKNALPPIDKGQKDSHEDETTAEIAQSVVFSKTDLFRKPGWKYVRFAHTINPLCLRSVKSDGYLKEQYELGLAYKTNELHMPCRLFANSSSFRPGKMRGVERLYFYGFGTCDTFYFPTHFNPYHNWSRVKTQDKINEEFFTYYSRLLRVHCSPYPVHYWTKLYKEGYLQFKNMQYYVPRKWAKRPKLTMVEMRKLAQAMELETLSSLVHDYFHKDWPADWRKECRVKFVSRSMYFLYKFVLLYINKAKAIDTHFLKLCRSMVLTLRTIMTRLIQDLDILNMWCPKVIQHMCAGELHENKKNRILVNSLILFIIHGLGLVEMSDGWSPHIFYEEFYDLNKYKLAESIRYYTF